MMSISLWPGGVVPYEFHPKLPKDTVETVKKAIAAWHEAATPVKLTPWSGDKDAEPNYVIFTPAKWCAAASGLLTGRQKIKLSEDCRMGVVLHEIGHTVGLVHEHTRYDRDDYVTVALVNVYANAHSQFAKQQDEGGLVGGVRGLPYDFGSIMHYSQMAFSANRHPTLIPQQARHREHESVLIGQRRALSDGDRAKLNNLYGGA
ncbi:MAG: M12 family metallopeptidase [Nocardioides sp.]